jgi:hypothetical protein
MDILHVLRILNTRVGLREQREFEEHEAAAFFRKMESSGLGFQLRGGKVMRLEEEE